MTTDPRRRERLAQATRERSEELARARQPGNTGPAAPGDLFVLPATSDFPVEWAVLERGPGDLWLAVPADAGPRAGSADVAVPAGEPGGPLSLRCGFAVSLDAGLLSPELRTGRLAGDTVTEALHRIRRAESGALEPSPLAEEVDADPEYQDWVRDVLEPARERAADAGRRTVSTAAGGWMIRRVAAALALISVGLGFWVFRLQQEVDRLSEPVLVESAGDSFLLGEEVRGGATLRVRRDATHIVLRMSLDPSFAPQEGYVEIARRSREPVWRSGLVRLAPGRDLALIILHDQLPYGDYRVRVFPAAGFGASPLAEQSLRIIVDE
jgi:hypothetical protein